jgi:hypothetical protein
MARYNTAPQTLEITGETTFTYAFTGGIISLTGITGYTVTMVSPVFFPGSKQTFYNATDGDITLETAAGLIYGNGVPVPNGSSVVIPKNSTYTLTSDGTNYVLTSALSGPAVFETPVTFNDLLDANGKVELNPLDNNVEIKPTGTGTVDISPQSSVSIQPGGVATIRPTNNLILTSASGTVTLGDAGKTTTIPGNLSLIQDGQTVNISPTGAGSVTIDPGGNVTIGSGGTLSISSDTLGSITNMRIGQSNPAQANFTSLGATGAVTFTANTASTSSTSGTLVVTGGLGVSGAIYGGSLQSTPIGSTTRSTGAFTTLTANDSVTLTKNTAATNSTTGTLVVTGGIGVSGAIYAGSIQNTPIGSSTANSGAFTTLSANSNVTFTGTTDSSSVNTGSVQMDGGLGVAKKVYAGTGFYGNLVGGTISGTTLTASSTVTLSPNNANVTLSPSGTGTTTISPAGGGSINNMTVGATTASTGKFTTLEATSGMYASRYIYHTGDTNTYIDFETDTISLYAGGSREVTINTTGVRLGDTGNGYFQPVSGNYGSVQLDGGAHGGWEGYSIGGRAVFMHDNGTGTGIFNDVDNEWLFQATHNGDASIYNNGTARLTATNYGGYANGEMRASSQIIAYYSDARLKNFEGKIDNALDKVMALNGYYYTENEVAKSLGYDNDERQVGVSAQEVLAVMPEVVKDAPINNSENAPEDADYKTVQYEKLVPLLIEAIKELKQEINMLKGDN